VSLLGIEANEGSIVSFNEGLATTQEASKFLLKVNARNLEKVFGEPKQLLTIDGGYFRPLQPAGAYQVLILSGGNSGGTPNESQYPDLNFFVSGSKGSKDSGVKGTSVFGGDLVVSGNLHVENKAVLKFQTEKEFFSGPNIQISPAVTYFPWNSNNSAQSLANNSYLWKRAIRKGRILKARIFGGVNDQNVMFSLFKWGVSESSPVGHLTASYAVQNVGVHAGGIRTRGVANFDMTGGGFTGTFEYEAGDYLGIGLSRDNSNPQFGSVSLTILFEEDSILT
jgi:hypothetical protein